MRHTLRRLSIAGACFTLAATTIAPSEVGATHTAVVEDTGGVTGKVQVVGAKHSGDAIVFLEGRSGKKREKRTHEVRQVEKQFSPQMLIIQKGDDISFPNGDKIFHNVFSMSKPARFDLGLYKSGSSKTVTFKRTGTVDVYCNIHPQMVAKILVVDNLHFITTNKDGKYSLTDVPPGDYKLTVWHPKGKRVTQDVTIQAGKNITANLQIKVKKGVEPHARKDGTPYGRYK